MAVDVLDIGTVHFPTGRHHADVHMDVGGHDLMEHIVKRPEILLDVAIFRMTNYRRHMESTVQSFIQNSRTDEAAGPD